MNNYYKLYDKFYKKHYKIGYNSKSYHELISIVHKEGFVFLSFDKNSNKYKFKDFINILIKDGYIIEKSKISLTIQKYDIQNNQ